MKFDIYKWQEVKIDETYERKQGVLRVMCSKPAALFVSALGVEVLAGVGTDLKIQIAEHFTYRIEAEDGARAFVESPANNYYRPETEVFTNLDRKPEESGTVLAVKQALRELQFAQRDTLKSIREERRKLEAARAPVAEKLTTPPPEAKKVEEEPEDDKAQETDDTKD